MKDNLQNMVKFYYNTNNITVTPINDAQPWRFFLLKKKAWHGKSLSKTSTYI